MAVVQVWGMPATVATAQWTGGNGVAITMLSIEITVDGGGGNGQWRCNGGRWGKSIFFLML